MRLTTYLTKSFRDRVELTAVERSCTMRHILEQGPVASYMAHLNIDPQAPALGVDTQKMVRQPILDCVKITTIISEETRVNLQLLKKVRGFTISHSLNRAIRWYLWESPEKSQPRRDFAEAFYPRLDIPEKDNVVLPSGHPDLGQIKSGSPVLIDSSIVMLAMDSRRLGYGVPRSTQCEGLVYDAKNKTIRGFVTPFIMEDLWTALRSAFQKKEAGTPPRGALPNWPNSIDDICRRLQAFSAADIETLPVIASDLEKALQLAKDARIDAKVAFSLAAMHRTVGSDFAFATANPEHLKAGAAVAKVFVPSDLDQIVPEGRWNTNRSVTPDVEKPVLKLKVIEAGSD